MRRTAFPTDRLPAPAASSDAAGRRITIAPVRLATSTAALACLLVLAACGTAPSERGSQSAAEGGYRTKLDGWGPKTPPRGLPKFVDHSVGQEEISMQAMGLVGIPYRWGGNTPAAGFDCSGLVRYVVENAADVQLPRTTSQMRYAGSSVEPDEIAPGDLVFFNTDGRPYSHVGVYVGNYRFVNAPSTGGTVRIDYISNPYWARHFDGIRRIAGRRATAPVPLDPKAPGMSPDGAPVLAPDTAYAQQPSRPPASDAAPPRLVPTPQAVVAAPVAEASPRVAAASGGNTGSSTATTALDAPAANLRANAGTSASGNDPIGAMIARADRQATPRATTPVALSTTAPSAPLAPTAPPPRAVDAYAPVSAPSRYRPNTGTFADAASRETDDPIARIASQAR